MKIGKEGLDLIKRFEGLRTRAYRDPVGILTIGYGSTGAHVKEGMGITEAEAEALLMKDLARFERGVAALVKVPLAQNQFDALVSFAFNCGLGALKRSTLLKRLNVGEYHAVPSELRKWDKAKGKVLRGLTRRRQAEAELWGRRPSFIAAPAVPRPPGVSTPSLWSRIKSWFGW